MSSSIVVPNAQTLGGYGPSIADALVTVATAAKADIDGLASTGGNADVIARFATTANLNLATTALTAVDGVTPVAGNIVLVKDQTTHSQNGLYLASASAWTRLKDASGADIVKPGIMVQVKEGTVSADLFYICTTNDPVVVGTDAIDFALATSAVLATATPQAVGGGAAGAAGTAATASKSDHVHAVTAATTSVPGSMSAADKKFLDGVHSAKGADLTDADATLDISQGTWRKMPAATLSADRTVTLSPSVGTPVAGDQITITRLDASAHQLIVVDGGAGTPTLLTMPVSKAGWIKAQFDGTNWFMKEWAIGTA